MPPDAAQQKAAADKAAADAAAAAAADKGGKPEGNGQATATAERLAALEAENKKLAADLEERNKRDSKDSEEKLRKQGEFEQLATKNAQERDQERTENQRLKRQLSIMDELHAQKELKFSLAAIMGVVKLIEDETSGKLQASELIKRAEARLSEWGVANTAGESTGGVGEGAGSGADRRKHADPRLEKYLKLGKQARMDRTKRGEFLALQAQLKADGVELPYIAA